MKTGRLIEVPLPGAAPGTLHLYRCLVEDLEPVGQWIDMYLRDDFFFRRGHLSAVLNRESNVVYAVLYEGRFAGIWIEYEGSILHNLYIEPAFRKLGVGAALVKFLRPVAIRAKTDMAAGDPTPFYQRLGYGAPAPDPLRPHILLVHDLQRGPERADVAPLETSGVPTGTEAPIAGPGLSVLAGLRGGTPDLLPGRDSRGCFLPVQATWPPGIGAADPAPSASAEAAQQRTALPPSLACTDSVAAERYRLIVAKRREKQIARREKIKQDKALIAAHSLRQFGQLTGAPPNGNSLHSPG